MSSYASIFEAAAKGTVEDVKYFIKEKGVDVNTIDNNRKETPLHIFCRFSSNLDVLKYLVSAGADLNARAIDGSTPLLTYLVRKDSDIKIVKALVSAGADITIKSNMGIDCLGIAEIVGNEAGNLAIFKYLSNIGTSGKSNMPNETGNNEKAEWDRLIQINPNDAKAYFFRSDVYGKSSFELEQKIADLETALRLGLDGEFLQIAKSSLEATRGMLAAQKNLEGIL